jgi:hypothetical protein
MPRTATFRLQQLAMYSAFVFRDPAMDAEDPDDEQARVTARESIIGASKHRAYLRAAQRAVGVRVDIELWDSAAPDAVTERWDVRHEAALTCPTGALLVENITAGPVPLEPGGDTIMCLPGGAIDVRLRVYARDRDTADEVDRVYEETVAVPFEETAARLRQLDGRERYLVQVWPT